MLDLPTRYLDSVRFVDRSFGVHKVAWMILAALELESLDLRPAGSSQYHATSMKISAHSVQNDWETLRRESNKVLDRLTCHTYPLYNGRECGFVLVAGVDTERRVCAYFGECRGSDSFFAMVWADEYSPFDPPTIANISEKMYKARSTFRFDRVIECAAFIRTQFAEVICQSLKVKKKKRK